MDAALANKDEFLKHQLNALPDNELDRLEFFVRSKINRDYVKRIMEDVVRKRSPNLQISEEMGIIVASLCKSHLGEIIEAALQVSQEEEEENNTMDRDGIQMTTSTNNISNTEPVLQSMTVSIEQQNSSNMDISAETSTVATTAAIYDKGQSIKSSLKPHHIIDAMRRMDKDNTQSHYNNDEDFLY